MNSIRSLTASRPAVSRALRAALCLAVAASAAPARAVDAPHDEFTLAQSCLDCHVPHFSPLPNLQGQDCMSCHNSRGVPFGTWAIGDQATVAGATGSSHSWSGAATNASAGAAAPANAEMAKRITENGGNLSCATCHDPHTQFAVGFDPSASKTAGAQGRHFMRVSNGNSEMCRDCHSSWSMSREAARTYTGTARSHPVLKKNTADATPTLTMANAGSGPTDPTYNHVPLDVSMQAAAATGSTASVINLDAARFKFATNILANWTLRFTTGVYRNVQVRIGSSAASSVTLAVALPAAPAVGDRFEIDRAGSPTAYDVTTNAGTAADQLQDTSKSWPTSATGGNNSPTAGAGSVTILSTTAGRTDAGKTCTIVSNTATVLTLQAGCLSSAPAGGTWAYRINWRTAGKGTTSALGTTTTFVDATRTLWGTDSIAGLQVRFPATGAVARVTNWNATTFTATFTPSLGGAVAAGTDYVLEPVSHATLAGTALSGTTTTMNVSGTPFAALTLRGALIRFTRSNLPGNTHMVSRITNNTATQVTFTAMSGTVFAGDAYEIDLDGNATNNLGLGDAAGGSITAGNVVCQSCHGVHMADSDAGTYDRAPGGGDGNLLRRAGIAASSELCDGCHETGVHSSVAASSKYGTWGTSFTCGTCHDPHGTTNIYLVKSPIATPNSGSKNVDFRNQTGAATNSYAAPTATAPTTEVCTVCHTQTTRARNSAATDWSTHFSSKCTTCHTHQGGFRAGESDGNTPCGNCHNFGMVATDATATAGYHHVLVDDLVVNAGATQYPNTVANKTCVSCHVDHNVFRTDKNPANTLGRGANLRTQIQTVPTITGTPGEPGTAPAGTGYYLNRDYDAAAAQKGVCISCHATAQTKNQTSQKSDGTVATPAIDATQYAASAHAYSAAGRFSNGAGAFTVSCVKCHSDGQTGYQNGAAKVALHTSVDRRLRAPMGQAAQQDDQSEAFCFRCHSRLADAAAIGGTAKTAANYDWYGAVTNMSAASQDVYARFPGPTTYTTTASATLYLRDTNAINAVQPTKPAAYQYSSGTYTTNTFTQRDMAPASGAVAATAVIANGTTAARYNRGIQFVSPPIDNTVTIPSGSTFTLTIRESQGTGTGVNNTRFTVYKWNGTTATPFNTSAAPSNFAQNATAITTTPTNRSTVFTSNQAVTLNPGDAIVVDVEFLHASGTTAINVTYAYGAFATDAAALALPAGTYSWRTTASVSTLKGHNPSNYSGLHRPNPSEETGAYIAAYKHVECEDCHNPHATRPGLHTRGSNVAGAALTGAPAVQPTFSGTNWQIATPVTYTATTVGATTPEAYVCFRCHSNYNTAIPNDPNGTLTAPWNVGGGGFTNQALEFSTSNQSYHPVLGALPATDTGGSSQLTANQLCNATSCSSQAGGFQTWTPGQTMTCSDCHNAEAASPAAQGPHGSAVTYMLAGVNRAWPYNLAGATSGTLITVNNAEVNIGSANGLFCRNCHPSMRNATYTNSLHGFANTTSHSSGANNFVACVGCHIRVPHGGRVSRLIVTPGAPLRYRVAGQTQTMIGFTKGTRTSYSGTAGWDSNCIEHGTTGGEAW